MSGTIQLRAAAALALQTAGVVPNPISLHFL
jgi:hypothetical protein